jgi:hypothetical protein
MVDLAGESPRVFEFHGSTELTGVARSIRLLKAVLDITNPNLSFEQTEYREICPCWIAVDGKDGITYYIYTYAEVKNDNENLDDFKKSHLTVSMERNNYRSQLRADYDIVDFALYVAYHYVVFARHHEMQRLDEHIREGATDDLVVHHLDQVLRQMTNEDVVFGEFSATSLVVDAGLECVATSQYISRNPSKYLEERLSEYNDMTMEDHREFMRKTGFILITYHACLINNSINFLRQMQQAYFPNDEIIGNFFGEYGAQWEKMKQVEELQRRHWNERHGAKSDNITRVPARFHDLFQRIFMVVGNPVSTQHNVRVIMDTTSSDLLEEFKEVLSRNSIGLLYPADDLASLDHRPDEITLTPDQPSNFEDDKTLTETETSSITHTLVESDDE